MQDIVEIVGEHVLVADDDEDIRTMLVAWMQRESYAVSAAASAAEIRAIVAETAIDLIVLDLTLPDGDGLALCKQMRAEGFDGAIIMVTARDAAIDRVLGLELGADDYLTKPFEPRELMARVRNLLRRARRPSEARPRGARFAVFGIWRLDLIGRRLIAPDGRLVILAGSEYRLLERFLEAPNRVLSREALSTDRKATAAFDRTIVLQVSRLRQKLMSAGGEELILTVRNEGYVFVGEVRFE